MSSQKAKINITEQEASKLFRAANTFADALEDIFESQGRYTDEFVKGLKLSVKQAKTGNLKKILSLTEL